MTMLPVWPAGTSRPSGPSTRTSYPGTACAHEPGFTGSVPVGRADRLSFVEDRRVAVEERAVQDVGVAHDPPQVGRGPVDLSGLHPVDVFHAPRERDQVPAVVADDALRHAGRPRRVED